MLLSWNLLKKFFVDEALVTQHIDPILKCLTMAGLELEEKISYNPGFTGVVLGKIVSCEKHPDADSLSVCQVNVGGSENLLIVCGAPNAAAAFEQDMLVPVALIGAVLPGDFKITARKLRGIESQGMICSISELELDKLNNPTLEALSKEDGIWHIQKFDARLLGVSLAEYLSIPDNVIEFKITPNRGDCLSYLGIAREIKLLADNNMNLSVVMRQDFDKILQEFLLCNEVFATHRLYYLLGLEKIQTKDMINDTCKARTAALLNMLLLGEYMFQGKDHLIFSQFLDPVKDIEHIRCFKKDQTVPVSAIYRLERGMALNTHSNEVIKGILNLLQVSGITVKSEKNHNHINNIVKLSYIQMLSYIGDNILWDIFKNILSSIGEVINVDVINLENNVTDHIIEFRAFDYRFDLHTQQDIIEEIVRIYGYDKIKSQLPKITINPLSDSSGSSMFEFIANLKERMISFGFYETVNYSFIEEQAKELFGSSIQLQNGIANLGYMRSSLIPSLLKVAQHNMKHGADSLRIFEVSKIYLNEPNLEDATNLLYETHEKQPQYLSGLVCGSLNSDNYTITIGQNVKQGNRDLEFFDLKHILQNILPAAQSSLIFKEFNDSSPEYSYLVPSHSAFIFSKNQPEKLGYIGRVHPKVTNLYGIKSAVFVFEIDVYLLKKIVLDKALTQIHKIEKDPVIVKDLSFIVPNELSFQSLVANLESIADKANLVKYRLFDIYKDEEKLPKNHYSIAIRFYFNHKDATNIDEQLNIIVKNFEHIHVRQRV